MRLRRWLLNQKELIHKEGNLVLTNEVLKSLGLKSLVEIKERFGSKKRRKSGKGARKKEKTGQSKKDPKWAQLESIELKYYQKLILEELRKLTGLVKKLERRVANLERKLDK